MSSFNQNSKKISILPQDSLVPKNFGMSKNMAKFHNIARIRACKVPITVLVEPLKILVAQNQLNNIKFYKQGMFATLKDHNSLIGLLINSVKYN